MHKEEVTDSISKTQGEEDDGGGDVFETLKEVVNPPWQRERRENSWTGRGGAWAFINRHTSMRREVGWRI